MRILRNWALVRTALALGIVLVAAGKAPAFYWTLRVAPSLITPNEQPGNPPNPGAEPIPLPPDPPAPPGGGGGTVPEPTTAAAGLIGIGVLGLRRWLKKS